MIVNIIENLMIIVIIVDMEVKGIVKVMKGSGEYMTEKRFVDYFDKDHNYIIQDLQNEDEYQVGFVNCDEDVFLKLVNKIADENEYYKSIFFELIETALTDKSCRELYCKGILDIFNKANSLNQAREMIKERLE